MVLALVLLGLAPGAAFAAPTHPLDPLTADELATLRDILRHSDAFSAGTNFAWIALDEPPKRFVEAWRPGQGFPRRAYAAAIDYGKKKTFAVIVDLKARKIVSVTDLAGLQPGINADDTTHAQALIDTEPKVKDALEKRGIKVPGRVSDSVRLLYESVGHDPGLARAGGRLVRVLFRSDATGTDENSTVIDGLEAVVNLFTGRVQIEDEPGAPSVRVPYDVFDPSVRGTGPHLDPIVPAAPQQHNFVIDGNEVRWGSWRFRVGFDLREGVVLYGLGFEDQGRVRPIAYRASLAEVLTAYGDPSRDWAWMEYLDEGDFGLGYSAAGVVPGREVPANAVTMATVLPDPDTPQWSNALTDRVYLYERDGGALVYYQQDGRAVHARATELVVGFVASLGNYDYFLNWVFHADGSFAFEAELAGEILTKFVRAETCSLCAALAAGPGATTKSFAAEGDDAYGTLVHPRLVGVNHQHWFMLRIDFDVDGDANAVVENDAIRGAGVRTMGTTETVFAKAKDAARDIDDEAERSWTIYNPHSLDRVGRPAGYRIVPMGDTESIVPPGRARGPAGFTLHHFWVTPYREHEIFADGWYPTQAGESYDDTLYRYANDAPIFDRDIVAWYALGESHMPLMEDWPLMSDATLSVEFRPDGFFARNPALAGASDR